MTEPSPAVLYIIATPIGNLEDISQRALRLLAEVNCIYAEDTRQTRRLLNAYGIKNTLHSLHEHNERQKVTELQAKLDEGQNLALVSDAGTPLISDPGFNVVNILAEKGYCITPIPGACAVIAALSASGLTTDRFIFEGFLPAKSKSRRDYLHARLHESATQVYYESCHRVIDSIKDFIEIYGEEREIVLAREITKLHEQFYRGSLGGLLTWLIADTNHVRGEFVLLLAGHKTDSDNTQATLDEALVLKTLLAQQLPLKQAATIAASLLGKGKNELYRQLMAMKD